jgi:hypothetical protein
MCVRRHSSPASDVLFEGKHSVERQMGKNIEILSKKQKSRPDTSLTHSDAQGKDPRPETKLTRLKMETWWA